MNPIRSQTEAPRDVQHVGAAGPYELEVLVRVLGSGSLEIEGQVTRARSVHEPIVGLPVVLFDADALVSTTQGRTNALGEFDMVGQPDTRYFIALGEAQDAPCMLIWEGKL